MHSCRLCVASKDKAVDRSEALAVLERLGVSEIVSNTALKIYERNATLHMVRSPFDLTPATARTSADEKIDCIREARVNWEQGINEELLAIAKESQRKFCLVRLVHWKTL
jgi:hypothetical protein